MKLEFLNTDLSVCKYDVPVYPAMGFVFTGKTDSEFSLVCETRYVPNGWTEKESGWSVFRVAGQLDFSLVGILAPIANILADENIGIFAVSTYDTDYILVKSEKADKAVLALKSHGYTIEKK